MRIEELAVGSNITFCITINNKTLNFDSKITEVIPRKRLVLADAILRDGKVLSFKGKGVAVNVVASLPDSKPLLFKDVIVESLKMDENSYCYNLVTAKEGVPFNRRRNYRCFVGNPSPLYDRGDVTDREIIIRDVSTTGFAITCDSGLDFPIDQLIHVHLEDYLDELDENYSFHLYGLVVRRQELEHGKIVYGCRLTGNIIGLENYIAKKERLNLRKSRGS